jgi:hypothetical protein
MAIAIPSLCSGQELLSQQQHAHTDQCGREPAAAVDVFMQYEFSQDGGADISKRRGRGRDEAGITPGERGKQTEKAEDEAA